MGNDDRRGGRGELDNHRGDQDTRRGRAQADVVVALKPGLDLPDHPAVETWPLPDPAGWDVEGIRRLRDHIDARVRRLVDQLQTP